MDILVRIVKRDGSWECCAYIFATQAHVVDVEGDHGHGGGEGDEADGDAVVESCKSQWSDDILDNLNVQEVPRSK